MREREIAEKALPGAIGPGIFVAIAGPSGVGKDTLIDYARHQLGGRREFVFVRRIITRNEAAGYEDHEAMSPPDFARAAAAGRFSLLWQAHGLSYALPASIDAELRANRIVIANISRQLIDQLQARYANVALVVVSAHRDLIARRLALRGRETPQAIAARLGRITVDDTVRHGAIRIENSGPLELAGNRLVSILEGAAADCANAS